MDHAYVYLEGSNLYVHTRTYLHGTHNNTKLHDPDILWLFPQHNQHYELASICNIIWSETVYSTLAAMTIYFNVSRHDGPVYCYINSFIPKYSKKNIYRMNIYKQIWHNSSCKMHSLWTGWKWNASSWVTHKKVYPDQTAPRELSGSGILY